MEIATLKNGSEEPLVLVQTTMMALDGLIKSNPVAIYELVEKCNDPTHELFGNAGDILGDAALIKDGTIHTSIKNIVLSAMSGEGFDMILTNPISNTHDE